MPAYTDPTQPRSFKADELSLIAWDAQMDAIRTAKWAVHGAGFGLALFGALAALAILHFRLWRPGSFARLRTPDSRWRYMMLLTVAVWIGFVVATAFDFGAEHQRELVPFWDDAAERSIPYAVLPLSSLCAISVLVKLLTTWRLRLWTGVYGRQAGILLFAAALFGFHGKWVALPLALGAYLALCGRAVRVAAGGRLPITVRLGGRRRRCAILLSAADGWVCRCFQKSVPASRSANCISA